eukprot:1157235-Pelagomonas_calceolata.AAC.3
MCLGAGSHGPHICQESNKCITSAPQVHQRATSASQVRHMPGECVTNASRVRHMPGECVTSASQVHHKCVTCQGSNSASQVHHKYGTCQGSNKCVTSAPQVRHMPGEQQVLAVMSSCEALGVGCVEKMSKCCCHKRASMSMTQRQRQ